MIRLTNHYSGVFPEMSIGSYFEWEGRYYRVARDFQHGCINCAFKTGEKPLGCIFRDFPMCISDYRTDHYDVVYKEVDALVSIGSIEPMYFLETNNEDVRKKQ